MQEFRWKRQEYWRRWRREIITCFLPSHGLSFSPTADKLSCSSLASQRWPGFWGLYLNRATAKGRFVSEDSRIRSGRSIIIIFDATRRDASGQNDIMQGKPVSRSSNRVTGRMMISPGLGLFWPKTRKILLRWHLLPFHPIPLAIH